jgi:hypothetical protein
MEKVRNEMLVRVVKKMLSQIVVKGKIAQDYIDNTLNTAHR